MGNNFILFRCPATDFSTENLLFFVNCKFYFNKVVVADHCIINNYLKQEKFARMTLKQYTIESMSYLTTGILDGGEEDASVEAAMCKVCWKLRVYSVNVCYLRPPWGQPKWFQIAEVQLFRV